MINRLCFVALTAVTLTISAPVVRAATIDYDVTVDVTSGPLAGDRYSGVTSVKLVDGLEPNASQPMAITADSLEPDASQPMAITANGLEPDASQPMAITANGLEPNASQPMAITFDFLGTEFTEADDSRDADANSPRANFYEGDFVGATYTVSRFSDNPTDIPVVQGIAVDGFAIDNHEFGYTVGADLYRGVVNYRLSARSFESADPQPVSEPSLWLGLVTAGCGGWLARCFSKETEAAGQGPAQNSSLPGDAASFVG